MKIYFDQKLIKSTIKSRINRFIFIVEINGEEVEAHCPTGGIIAGLSRKDIKDLPCLTSDHGSNTSRRTRYTVEAVSLDNGLTYMGINQTKSNRYVEEFLRDKEVARKLQISDSIKREKKLGDSRIDFKVDDCYIEVKTMVAEYYCEASENLKDLMRQPHPSVERMQKHVNELANEIKFHKSRAAIITVFQYDAPTFKPPIDDPAYLDFVKDLKSAQEAGLEQYQMNIMITEEYAELVRFEEFDLF